MSLPIARVKVYRTLGSEVALSVAVDGALIHGVMRESDVRRLVHDLTALVGMATFEQPKEVEHVQPV